LVSEKQRKTSLRKTLRSHAIHEDNPSPEKENLPSRADKKCVPPNTASRQGKKRTRAAERVKGYWLPDEKERQGPSDRPKSEERIGHSFKEER